MAELHLPPTLPPLFGGLPRRLELEAATVDEAIGRLDERWPGLRDRLCEPGPVLRPHINVFVDRERAALDTALDAGSRVDVIAAISGGCAFRAAGAEVRPRGKIRRSPDARGRRPRRYWP